MTDIEPEYSESELAAMQAENIALKAELAKKDEETKQKLKKMEEANYVYTYVIYCIQRQRIIQRAKTGCGRCDVWKSTHLQDFGY